MTCLAHDDRTPSLQVTQGERAILLKCWAGCSLAEICASLGIRPADLFFDAPLPRGHRPTRKPTRIDRIALAFKYELAALDLRLRSETIIQAGNGLDLAPLTDDELDQALNYMDKAHSDRERAKLFEDVADHLRSKEFTERDHEHARRVA